MKLKTKIIIASCILLVAIVVSFIPLSVYAGWLKSGVDTFAGYLGNAVDEIYNLKKQDSAKSLVNEIIVLEKGLSTPEAKMALLPHLTALIEKGDELSEKEIIDLIQAEDTDIALENALVVIYSNNGYDSSKLFALLDDASIAEETKGYIIAYGDLSAEELSIAFEKFDNSVSVTAMINICAADDDAAYSLANTILRYDPSTLSEDKLISAFLGVAAYFEKDIDLTEEKAKEKEEAISKIMDIYNSSTVMRVKDQAIYALARISDYELFARIIENDKIDSPLKCSTIERNMDTMINKIKNSNSIEEISAIYKAMMEILPIYEVGEALETEIANGNFENSDKAQSLIRNTKYSGIRGLYEKYENRYE